MRPVTYQMPLFAWLVLSVTAAGADDKSAYLQSSAQSVPRVISEDDNSQRILLLTSQGPLVLEATIFVEGKPYRTERDELAGQMVDEADADGDGKSTWLEAFGKTSFPFGLRGLQQRTENDIAGEVATYDKNKDGLMDRAEARLLLAAYTGTGSFYVQNTSQTKGWNGYGWGGWGSNRKRNALLTLLDRDGDTKLSQAEIAAATGRLRSRDANGDDWLTLDELNGGSAYAPFLDVGFG